MEFNPDLVSVRDVSLEVVAVHHLFRPEYFIKYECPEPVKVVITKSLIDALGMGFKDDVIDFEVSDKVRIIGRTETYEEDLLKEEAPEFPIKMKVTPQGVIPENFEPVVLATVDSDLLKELPSADKYTFISDGKQLKVSISDTGTYTRTLPTKPNPTLGELKATFDGEHLSAIVHNLRNIPVNLLINSQVIVLAQISKEASTTYILSAMEE
jgi:hypothetical protein